MNNYSELMKDYAELKKENERLYDLHLARTKLTTDVINQRDELYVSLVQANNLCRSAYQIARRQLDAGTNWEAFREQLATALEKQQSLLNATEHY